MFTAGELAKNLGISARTVQFYDEKGILKPIDHSEAGYRMYDESSVETLQKILMLRFLDFSLEQVGDMIGADNADVRQSLKEQEKLLLRKIDHLERVLATVRQAQTSENDTLWQKLRQIIEITQEREFTIEQYQDEGNLNKRINIHDYSTAEVGFYPWMLEKLHLEPGMRILEIGCGNAAFWKAVAPCLPEKLEIHLTDYSEGMLESAEKTVMEIQETFPEKHLTFTLAKKDAEKFTCSSTDFDRIMANHLLFHMKKDTRPALYQTIRKLLKKDGIFSCSLIGREHNRELHHLVKRFYPKIKIRSESFDIFLETAEDELQPFFPRIESWEQKNDLLVPDAELIYNYVASYSKEAKEILQKDKANFLRRVESEKNPEGFMYIHKSTGVVVCHK